MNINDNITLGSYQFSTNPEKYSVDYVKLKSSRRSLNGTLQTTYITDESGNVVMKRSFNISGLSYDQIQDILDEFKKAENLTFIDIYNATYTVQFDDFQLSVSGDSVQYPEYQITLTEV